MEDETILELYWQRNELAVTATSEKYGKYCASIAKNILANSEDVEECVNDTWLRAWNAIPPHRPDRLALFLGKITRELAINRWRAGHVQKRGQGELPLALEELDEVVSGGGESAEQRIAAEEMGQAVSRFLRGQSALAADVFVRRYYHLCPVRQIAAEYSISESRAKSILFRTRKKLRAYLEREGLL